MAGPEKIQGHPQLPPELSPSKATTSRPDTSNPIVKNQPTTDIVEFSPEKIEYQQVLTRIDQTPDTRADRLNQIRQALEAGTYQIDSEIVADRLIRESLTNSLTTNQSPDSSPPLKLP